MALPRVDVKARSHRSWPFVLALVAATGLGTVGCIIIADDSHTDDESWSPSTSTDTTEPALVTIDPDTVFVDVVPGEGVGMFVEYTTGGRWHVWTTCDSNYSGVACAFHATITVDTASQIAGIQSEELEGLDEAALLDAGTIVFDAATNDDIDGVYFDATPGAIVRLDMTLDQREQPRFVYWFGDGVLHKGAPTNPIDFQPKSP